MLAGKKAKVLWYAFIQTIIWTMGVSLFTEQFFWSVWICKCANCVDYNRIVYKRFSQISIFTTVHPDSLLFRMQIKNSSLFTFLFIVNIKQTVHFLFFRSVFNNRAPATQTTHTKPIITKFTETINSVVLRLTKRFSLCGRPARKQKTEGEIVRILQYFLLTNYILTFL